MLTFIVASYDEKGKSNAMNAAWGGIYTDGMIGICLSKDMKEPDKLSMTGKI